MDSYYLSTPFIYAHSVETLPSLKVPICSFDAKTGILCPKCEAKLKTGHITKTDVETSVKLVKLSEKLPELNRATLVRALPVNGDTVLVLSAGDVAYIRHDPDTVKKIENELRSRVWMVEGETSDRRVLEDLFYPTRILTVNVVWLPDGSKLTKVIIPGWKTDRFPLDIERVKKVVKTVRGIDLLVEFERH